MQGGSANTYIELDWSETHEMNGAMQSGICNRLVPHLFSQHSIEQCMNCLIMLCSYSHLRAITEWCKGLSGWARS